MNTGEANLIFNSLKRILKSRQLTYRQLANKLGKSESSIKRIFSQNSCSLSQLLEICQSLDLSLSQLTSLYSLGDLPKIKITPQIEEFFINNKDYFNFLRQLSLLGSVKAVKQQNDLSNLSAQIYIKKLVEFGLLKPVGKSEYKLVEQGFIQLTENSRLKKVLRAEWGRHILHQANEERPGYIHLSASTRLKKESIEKFRKNFESVISQMKEQGFIENISGSNDVKPIGISCVIAPEIVNFPNKIPNIK